MEAKQRSSDKMTQYGYNKPDSLVKSVFLLSLCPGSMMWLGKRPCVPKSIWETDMSEGNSCRGVVKGGMASRNAGMSTSTGFDGDNRPSLVHLQAVKEFSFRKRVVTALENSM